jgi:crossover junction endodeoxyribonuclease RuvC
MPALSRILGIDPGLAHCGWGVIEARGSKLTPLAYGTITTQASQNIAVRLAAISHEISAVVERYKPVELGIETIYHKGNPRSSIATAQARGAALAACASLGVRVGEYSPATIKKTVVGHGAAEKEQVQFMVQQLLQLETRPSPDHAADALAAAICQARMRGLPA